MTQQTLPASYAISATLRIPTTDGGHRVRQVPTFYLNANVQGIVSEAHARRIAEDIINPLGTFETHITAVSS